MEAVVEMSSSERTVTEWRENMVHYSLGKMQETSTAYGHGREDLYMRCR